MERRCTLVAMESNGVYWEPVYKLLEELGMTVWVVNAQDVQNVPGRNTDMKDAEWIAALLQQGLLRPRYIPDRRQRDLRELVRYRRSLIEERAREVNRLQKVLEVAKVKLGDVVSKVMGKSSRTILERLAAGETDPAVLVEQAQARLQAKRERFMEALRGLVGSRQRHLLAMQLEHIRFLEAQIEKLDRAIGERMRPFEPALEAVDEIPGVGRRTAGEVPVETSTEMRIFPTEAHLSSWAGLCLGNHESAGKRLSGRTRQGNPRVRRALVEAARPKGTYLAAQYRRIAALRGANRRRLRWPRRSS